MPCPLCVGPQGDESAKSRLLLPSFVLYLRVCAVVSTFWIFFATAPYTNVMFNTGGFDPNVSDRDAMLKAVLIGLNWGSFHFLFIFVAILFLHPGMGTRTFVKAGVVAGLAGLYSGGACLLWTYYTFRGGADEVAAFWIQLAWMLSMWGFYGSIWLAPTACFPCHRRLASTYYAAFWFFEKV